MLTITSSNLLLYSKLILLVISVVYLKIRSLRLLESLSRLDYYS